MAKVGPQFDSLAAAKKYAAEVRKKRHSVIVVDKGTHYQVHAGKEK